jgi:hypothetical protein
VDPRTNLPAVEVGQLPKTAPRALLPQKVARLAEARPAAALPAAARPAAAQNLQLSNVITEVRLLAGRKLPVAEAEALSLKKIIASK